MNRQEAYEIMKQGRYITHPVLVDADVGPLSLNGNTICGKNNNPLGIKWKETIESQRFSSGWIECSENGIPLNP